MRYFSMASILSAQNIVLKTINVSLFYVVILGCGLAAAIVVCLVLDRGLIDRSLKFRIALCILCMAVICAPAVGLTMYNNSVSNSNISRFENAYSVTLQKNAGKSDSSSEALTAISSGSAGTIASFYTEGNPIGKVKPTEYRLTIDSNGTVFLYMHTSSNGYKLVTPKVAY